MSDEEFDRVRFQAKLAGHISAIEAGNFKVFENPKTMPHGVDPERARFQAKFEAHNAAVAARVAEALAPEVSSEQPPKAPSAETKLRGEETKTDKRR